MRVLHVVKTSDGAQWAVRQVHALVQLGVDVHVALPSAAGETVEDWRGAGATLHVVDCTLPVRRPDVLGARVRHVRDLVAYVRPDIIHSHFVTTTVMLRLALGRNHAVRRIFQVPGPLHMEHGPFRHLDLATAGPLDHWIASSAYIRDLYLQSGTRPCHVHLSYYSDEMRPPEDQPGGLRARFGIPARSTVVGNINLMYPPKRYLGQSAGLKRHEDVIDALAIVCRERSDVIGVLVGGQRGGGHSYEQRLRARAARAAGERIILTGLYPAHVAPTLWREFDCAVHVPSSENCGGVVEALFHHVPTIASSVGGLPEVVIDGVTGWLVPPCDPQSLARVVLEVLADGEEAKHRAHLGSELVRTMFDPMRTAREVAAIYRHVLDSRFPAPEPFQPARVVASIAKAQGTPYVTRSGGTEACTAAR